LGLGLLVALQVIEIFEKEQPRGLLGVIELRSAARLFPEDIVDVFECLLEPETSVDPIVDQTVTLRSMDGAVLARARFRESTGRS
jgi:hypothetical protein